MTNNPLQMKVAAPYANALFDFSNEQNVMHKVTADFQNLEIFLKQAPELLEFLNNPLVTIKSKNIIISKVFQSQVNKETFQYLLLLVRRNRINLLQSIVESYLELVYRLASVKMVEVSTAFPFTNRQKNTLIKKLKQITKAREIRLFMTIDNSLIGGFLIKTDSKIIDFTIKNQLKELAKHLDSALEI
jgi:F-type H+-transporting ATPase subunit delta